MRFEGKGLALGKGDLVLTEDTEGHRKISEQCVIKI
jgi:hypothetical protein